MGFFHQLSSSRNITTTIPTPPTGLLEEILFCVKRWWRKWLGKCESSGILLPYTIRNFLMHIHPLSSPNQLSLCCQDSKEIRGELCVKIKIHYNLYYITVENELMKISFEVMVNDFITAAIKLQKNNIWLVKTFFVWMFNEKLLLAWWKTCIYKFNNHDFRIIQNSWHTQQWF